MAGRYVGLISLTMLTVVAVAAAYQDDVAVRIIPASVIVSSLDPWSFDTTAGAAGTSGRSESTAR